MTKNVRVFLLILGVVGATVFCSVILTRFQTRHRYPGTMALRSQSYVVNYVANPSFTSAPPAEMGPRR